MAKLTLTDGTIFEGTTEELIALTEQFSGKVADPVADSITHNGVEYTLVNRKAQEGDVVVFTESDMYYASNGKPYEVEENVGKPTIIDNVGDKIRVYNRVNRRTEANTLVYEPKAEAMPTPLKVGDYAKILSTECQLLRGFSDGDIVEVVKNGYGEDDVDYRVKKIGGEHTGYVKKSAEFVRKATDEEVAEAKAHAERNAVFMQAGRKPNEYRKGDIVRIVVASCVNNDGDIGEVTEEATDGTVRVQVNGKSSSGNWESIIHIKPIVFAESRLDLRK